MQPSQPVNVVMHLIFLGVVKTMIQMVQGWSKNLMLLLGNSKVLWKAFRFVG